MNVLLLVLQVRTNRLLVDVVDRFYYVPLHFQLQLARLRPFFPVLAVQLLHLTREFVLLFLVLVFGLVDCSPAVLTFLKDLLVLLLLSQIVALAVVLKHLVPVAFVIVDGGNLVVTFLLDGDLILSFFVVSF